ncbi:MAG: M28 family peptidase [Planctomycetota bacterium]
MFNRYQLLLPLYVLAFTSAFSLEAPRAVAPDTTILVNPTATPVRPSVDPKVDKSELLGHIQFLASPDLRGREAGTPDQLKAADYIVSEFTRYGLQPFGDEVGGKRGFFQEFPIITFKGLGKNSSMKITVGDIESTLTQKKQFLPLAAGYKLAKADAGIAFSGYGISAPELKYDDFAGLDLAGKWAMILRYDPPAMQKSNGEHSKYAALNSKVMACALRKAAGVLLVTGQSPDEKGSEEKLLGKNVPPMIGDFSIPVIHITRAVADKLLAPTTKKIADLQSAIKTDFANHSFVIPGVKAAAVSDIDVEEKKTVNVIARLEGSDPVLKNECVIVGAHCDHVGMGYENSLLGKDGAGKMHPGADDNASGTAGMLEIAQYIASLKPDERPKRSILFMAFSGEEIGLLGSEHYTKHPFIPLKDTAAMLNLDMIGRSSDGYAQVSGIGSSRGFKELITKNSSDVGVKLHFGSAGDGPSDHASFYKVKVPVLFFSTGTHADYHRPTDTWDKINAPIAAETAKLAAKAAIDLANCTDRPEFVQAGTGCYLGVGADEERQNVVGFPVADVAKGSPADQAGIRSGDVITALNDQRLIHAFDLMISLSEFSPGDEIDLKIQRGAESRDLSVKLGTRKSKK